MTAEAGVSSGDGSPLVFFVSVREAATKSKLNAVFLP